MNGKLTHMFSNQFVKNVFIMSSGTAAAQAISLLLTPFITRLYGPEAYGLMGIFMAIVSILAPIAALTYPIAIVLPKSDKDAIGIMKLSIIISICIAIFVGFFLLLFNEFIISIFGIQDLKLLLYFIPVVMVSTGIAQVLEQWLIRKKQFRISAKVIFIQTLITQGGSLGVGLINPVGYFLIIFSSLNNAIRAVMMLIFTRSSNYKLFYTMKQKSLSIKRLAKNYKDFPIFRAPETFINSISQSLPILLLSVFFGPVSAGLFSISKTVLYLPIQLVGKSVGDVFYPRISEAAQNGENLTRLIMKATIMLGVVGVIPFGVVIIIGPELFSFVFGEEWYKAGVYARWIAIWTFFGFMNRPSVKSLAVMSAQSLHLKMTIFGVVIRTIALLIGFIVFTSDIVSIALFGITGAIHNILLILLTIRLSKSYIYNPSNLG